MKIVLDTNVLVSGIFWRGSPHRILELWIQKKLFLIVTEDILHEYDLVLRRFSFKDISVCEHWLNLIIRNSGIVIPVPLENLCRDPADQKFLEAAVAAKADYLISGDKDLLILQEILGIPIVSASRFVGQIKYFKKYR